MKFQYVSQSGCNHQLSDLFSKKIWPYACHPRAEGEAEPKLTKEVRDNGINVLKAKWWQVWYGYAPQKTWRPLEPWNMHSETETFMRCLGLTIYGHHASWQVMQVVWKMAPCRRDIVGNCGRPPFCSVTGGSCMKLWPYLILLYYLITIWKKKHHVICIIILRKPLRLAVSTLNCCLMLKQLSSEISWSFPNLQSLDSREWPPKFIGTTSTIKMNNCSTKLKGKDVKQNNTPEKWNKYVKLNKGSTRSFFVLRFFASFLTFPRWTKPPRPSRCLVGVLKVGGLKMFETCWNIVSTNLGWVNQFDFHMLWFQTSKQF